MNKIIQRSLSFMMAFALMLGSFVNVHALSALPAQIELGQIHRSVSAIDAPQTQAFTDNFDSFNSSFWKSGYVWGNNDINMGNGNAANASVVKDTDGSYLCLKSPAANNIGVVTSVNQFSYGTYTARMKFTASNGTWPSFWALNDTTSWEIDPHESLGNDPARYYMTLHYNGEAGQGVYNNQESLANQWHTYSFTWTATDITFYLDDITKYSQKYSRPDLVNVMFTMGIMGNGTIWNGNRYDSTTFANGDPTLCVDYFSYTPSTVPPTIIPSVTLLPPTPTLPPSTPTAISPQTASPTSSPFTATPTTILVSPTLTQPPVETIYDNRNSVFVYSTGWNTVSTSKAYKDSYRETAKNNATAALAFTGQSFSIIYKGGATFSKFDVYVDGVLVGTLNQKMTTTAYQSRWNYPGQLALGNHTLKLVFKTINATTYHGSLDAVIVR